VAAYILRWFILGPTESNYFDHDQCATSIILVKNENKKFSNHSINHTQN